MTHWKSFKHTGLSIRTVVLISLLLSSVPAWGDNPRHQIHFVSENGRFVLLNLHRSIERVPIFEKSLFLGVMEQKREEDLWGLFDARAAELLEPTSEAQALKASHTTLYTVLDQRK